MVKTQLEPICLNRGAHPNSRTEIVHWDGRLDNRDNLRLRLRESLTGNSGDDALALAAYERWGIEGLVHLIGDWSAVIRDRTDGTVILASDFAGVRPLYYHVRSGQVLWSSRLQTLVERTGISELDEEWVAGFLNLSGSPNRTPHQGIYSVPPGHAVRISPRGVTITRFWTLPVGDVIRYRDESRYEEQLRALFREAVAVRLETDSAVLAELSGGLDSSSVVSMANHLIRSGAAAAPRIATVSYVWRNSLDESFIREIEGFCGIEGVHISTHENPPIDAAQVGEDMPAGMAPMRTSVAAVADRLGAKVVLTGQTGDLMMGNFFDDSLQVAAHLREFRLRRACRDALAWSKILSLPIYSILWSAGRAALPAALAPAAIYSRPDGSYMPKVSEDSLAAGLRKRTGLAGDGYSKAWMQAPPERRKYLRGVSALLESRKLQVPEPFQHLDYTHPFAHRPLVEFAMSVPVEILCGPGEPRRLMRRALADLWPEKLRKRRSKGLFSVPWHAALQPIAKDLLQGRQFQVVERGFVDRASLVSRLERLTAGSECNETQLQRIVLLELWLRQRAERADWRTRAA